MNKGAGRVSRSQSTESELDDALAFGLWTELGAEDLGLA
jgi:hypothetical protein